MKRCVSVVLVVIALIGFLGIRPACADAFEDAHQTAAIVNPAGVACVLQTANGATRFRVGERIPVRLSFTSSVPGLRVCTDLNPIWSTDVFHADSQAGVRSVVLYRPLGYSGPGPRISPVSSTPSSVDLALNDFLRFDAPGIYRVYATTNRLLPDKVDPWRAIETDRIPSCSTVLTVTVVPFDARWTHRQARQALHTVSDPRKRLDSVKTLLYQGTHEAAQGLLELLAREGLGARWTIMSGIGGEGLPDFADQQWIDNEIERDIRRNDLPISAEFLYVAARIPATDAYREANYREGADLATFWKNVNRRWLETADALPGKSSDAAPPTAYSLAYLVWRYESLQKDPEIAARRGRIESLLPEMLDRLPDDYLYDALGDDWPHLRSAPLLPSLQRLWRRMSAASKTDSNLRDKVWLRLGEQLPDAERRKLVLETMTARRIPVSEDAICSLPDETLPEIDDALASRLNKDKNEGARDARCAVIARYATAKILPRLRAWYAQNKLRTDCESRDLILSYFLRVAPDEGTVLVEQALRERGEGDCLHFLEDLAMIRPSPQLAAIATAHLHDSDPGIVADAKAALADIDHPQPASGDNP